MGEVIWATFPQYRKPQEIALEQMAAEVMNFALSGGPLPEWPRDDPSNWFYNSSPSDMAPPPEAS